MIWQLSEPSDGVLLTAENDGIWLRSQTADLSDLSALHSLKPKTRLGRLLPVLIPQLLELDIASTENKAVRIPFDKFIELEENEIEAFDNIFTWAPFAIEINTTGTLGARDFKYQLRFYWGRNPVHVERIGCFVKRGDKIYRLDKQSYTLVESVEGFNSLPSENRAKPYNALLCFSKIHGLSEEIGAEIDRYISTQKVIIPSKVGLDFTVDNNGRITFVPKIDGTPSDGMINAFLSSNDVSDVYSLESPEGNRFRVLLNDSQKEVLRRMQKVRHVGGIEKVKVLSNPYKIFDGVADHVEIDLNIFGPRVKGIGDFPFISQPFVSYGDTGIFDDLDIDPSSPKKGKLDVGIKCRYVDGRAEDIRFESRDELLRFYNDVKTSSGAITFKGKTILVDDELIKGVKDVVGRVTKRKTERGDTSSHRRYLLIYTNVEALEYDENKEEIFIGKSEFKLPHELLDNVILKPHQEAGLKWLQLNYLLNRRGCLLADDMGLGKTLQVLMFLSWLVERGDISPEGHDKERAPWNPILIIAPVMLLENETWINDMRTFFKGDGRVFEPNIVLHGSELKRFRLHDIAGRETEIEKPVLDLERLCQYRVVLTNYETITNYQYSFAMMKDNWSVVVTDEAQEYKTANTKISHALKSLFPKFRIACTGTPVETKLTDVWNIFDFLQPGLLGSASDFSKNYERPLKGSNSESISALLGQLRNQLLFGKQKSYVLRRDKDNLTDLPQKREHKLYCDLSEEQREKHIDFVERARSGGDGNHPFSMIHHLMKLYQHPALLLKEDIEHSEEALKRCPKLMKIIVLLKEIQNKDEKALIFTRSLDMQQLLATVISNTFRIHTEIINGGTTRCKSTVSGKNTRKAILDRFRNKNGFHVIILSPDVAGIGLTLTEANHVIHYGRWWNPAKESQATDRVYRIGQSKEVHVYYPITRDPQNVFKTFDEKLDALIDRRKKLASDFLLPMPGEDDLGKELWEDIFRDDNGGRSAKPLSKEDIRLLPWDRFESLIGLLEQKNGRKVILTPRSCDYGIDVISILGNEVKLIQCKHTTWDASVDIDVVAETINAFDSYRGRWLHGIANRMNLKPLLITNGKFTRAAKSHASVSDVQILSDNDLWKLIEDKPCTLAEIEVMENRRMVTMRDVQKAINSLVQ